MAQLSHKIILEKTFAGKLPSTENVLQFFLVKRHILADLQNIRDFFSYWGHTEMPSRFICVFKSRLSAFARRRACAIIIAPAAKKNVEQSLTVDLHRTEPTFTYPPAACAVHTYVSSGELGHMSNRIGAAQILHTDTCTKSIWLWQIRLVNT
jgi:hypothetical protein